jgi:hypothetical protein
MSEVLDPIGAAPDARSVRFRLLLAGACAAPIFWLGQLTLSYGVTAYACYPGDHPIALTEGGPLFAALVLFDIVALLACALGGAISWWAWRCTQGAHFSHRINDARTRFLALWGLMSSLWFFFAILFNAIVSVMVPLCAR